MGPTPSGRSAPLSWLLREQRGWCGWGRCQHSGSTNANFSSTATRPAAQTGAVSASQRTSSDLRLNPHLHLVSLDGAYHEEDGALVWEGLGHLKTSEVGEVLERSVTRMGRYLRRHGLLRPDEDDSEASGEGDPEGNLVASAVSGQAPPAGPQWVRGLAALEAQALSYDKPLCASVDGFTLHAATRAGGLDATGREALRRYVLRPPLAQERLELRPDGLMRITLKRAYADGRIGSSMYG
jgi:hypothetical protein